jgi:hypothetical protein
MADGGRTEVSLSGDERVMLNAFLDAQRDTLAWKCSSLSSEQLKQAASPPSPLSLRWITVRMIREYTRRTGHADFLRERIEGATGE